MSKASNEALADSSRVALAAYLHGLGKFAQRAALKLPPEQLAAYQKRYCPWRANGKSGYHTHTHAAYTRPAFELIAQHAPGLLLGDAAPFAQHAQPIGAPGSGAEPDTLAHVAAAYLRPETFLQWVVGTAARLASGLGREAFEKYKLAPDDNSAGRSPLQARLLPLLEQVRLEGAAAAPSAASLKWRYPLKALSAEAIFPQKREQCEVNKDAPAQQEYSALWQQFLQALEAIPAAHRHDWGLWLDHFDSAWLTYTHAIPAATAAGVQADVSLYDHSKTTAALAVALWRWHQAHGSTDAAAAARLADQSDWDQNKFLLVQGDFFGIQDFIFADGSQTRKDAARMLRGRSFQVSLFTELAALKVLDALALPPTSQISNAAGKFLIVAPNTAQARAQLEAVRLEINAWFLQHSFGLAGLGLASKAAGCNDFLHSPNSQGFRALMNGLFADLEHAKLQRFDLTGAAPTVFDVSYPHGVCMYNERLPADRADGGGKGTAAMSRDQIEIGKGLARLDRLLVLRSADALHLGGSVHQLELPIFGYRVGFTGSADASGKFGPLARAGQLVRCWDFSLPESDSATLWHGYARRYINAYVPRFGPQDLQTQAKYRLIADQVDADALRFEAGKTLNHIACEDRVPKGTALEGDWQGQVALMTLKGDVDNLGRIFQQGLPAPNLAQMAALSRQMNAFFAVYLPALCAQRFANTYTVFAGGDDFFLIGPWHSTQKLAAHMAERFQSYVCANPAISFSAGMVMTKPGLPMHTLAAQADEALDAAKAGSKNAALLFDQRVRWGAEWNQVQAAQDRLEQVRAEYVLSNSYVYGLLHLIDLATDSHNPEHAMWRSRFAYRTRRYVVDKIKEPERRAQAQKALADALGEQGINQLGARFRIPLFNHFYRQR